MERLLKSLLLKNKYVITYYEEKYYDMIIVQDCYGNALYVQIIEI